MPSGGDRSCAVLGCREVRLAAPSLEFALPLCAAHETTVQRLLSARSRPLAEVAEECRKTIVQGPTRKTRQGRELERPDGSRFPFICVIACVQSWSDQRIGAVRGWLRANCACLTEEINNAYVYRETDLRAWSQEASRLKRKHMCKRHPKSQGHPKVTPKWSKRRHKVIPKSSQSDPKVVQTSSQSDSKVIGQYEGLTRPHKVSQGLTRSHKVSQGPTRSHKVPLCWPWLESWLASPVIKQ